MRKIKYILGFCFLLLFTACNDWLDVKPLGQVEEEKMFEDEKGFLQTLTGTYTLLNAESAYGEELTLGMVDEIVHYWNEISKFYDFNYRDSEVEGRLASTWQQMYKAIANTNLVLKNLEGKQPGDLENFNLIKGEALGLRAYIHLDLLRLFGPVLKDGLEQKAIPYHEEFSNQIVKIMTAKEVLEKIEKDLLAAYTLLEEDPVKTLGRTYNANLENKDLAYQFRGIRMNYYAVCGTLARLYQLKNDAANALKYAGEVLEATDIFQLLKRDDIIQVDRRDLMFQRELIWALYDQNFEKKLGSKMGYNKYSIDFPFKEFVYEQADAYGNVADYRSAYLWTEVKMSTAYWIPAKYVRIYGTASAADGSREDKTPWEKLLPMMRLTEMYYIAAEANLENNAPEAYRLLNEVRVSRNLDPLPETLKNDRVALTEQLIYEYQKDTWGEGKLFYFYKHLFHDIITREGNIQATKALFELPIPKDELEFGGNE